VEGTVIMGEEGAEEGVGGADVGEVANPRTCVSICLVKHGHSWIMQHVILIMSMRTRRRHRQLTQRSARADAKPKHDARISHFALSFPCRPLFGFGAMTHNVPVMRKAFTFPPNPHSLLFLQVFCLYKTPHQGSLRLVSGCPQAPALSRAPSRS
jgi:hypothetical protein